MCSQILRKSKPFNLSVIAVEIYYVQKHTTAQTSHIYKTVVLLYILSLLFWQISCKANTFSRRLSSNYPCLLFSSSQFHALVYSCLMVSFCLLVPTGWSCIWVSFNLSNLSSHLPQFNYLGADLGNLEQSFICVLAISKLTSTTRAFNNSCWNLFTLIL